MISAKVLAIGLAIIVVAGGAATAIVLTANNDKSSDNNSDNSDKAVIKPATLTLASETLTPKLEVYGNVNEDMVIDQADVDALQAALDAGNTSTLSKYADADYNGVVDANDVTKINAIINATAESPVPVKHLCRFTSGDYYRISNVPVDAFVMSGSANMFMMMKYLGINSQIKGITYSGKVDSTLYSEYQTLFSDSATKYSWDGGDNAGKSLTYRVGGSAGYFNTELVLNHVTGADKVKAIFTCDNASTYLIGDTKSTATTKYTGCMTETTADDNGLGVFRFKAASTDMNEYISDLALMAFATDKDPSKLSEMKTWCENFTKDLNKKLRDNVGVTINQVRVGVTSSVSYSVKDGVVSTYNYISSGTSDYTAAAISAGGYFAFENYDFGTSSSSKKMTDLGEWTAPYNVDKIIHIKTAATSGKTFSWYGGTAKTDGKETLQIGPKAFSLSSPYYNNQFYVVCGDMPIVLRIAYCAHILYPEIFSESWAKEYNVSHSIQFLGMTEETINNGQFYVTMSDLDLNGKS